MLPHLSLRAVTRLTVVAFPGRDVIPHPAKGIVADLGRVVKVEFFAVSLSAVLESGQVLG